MKTINGEYDSTDSTDLISPIKTTDHSTYSGGDWRGDGMAGGLMVVATAASVIVEGGAAATCGGDGRASSSAVAGRGRHGGDARRLEREGGPATATCREGAAVAGEEQEELAA